MLIYFVLFSLFFTIYNQEISCPLRCDCYQMIINCNKKNLTEIPKISFYFTQLLNLDENQIQNIDEQDFTNLNWLLTLQVSYNNLSFIHRNAFRRLKKIEKIYLNNNQIGVLEDGLFSNLENLKNLNLQNNQIKFIGENVFLNLYSIQRINLENNRLITLNKNIGLFYNILKINLNLSLNPINCDCNLIWLVDKIKINQINLLAKCDKPYFLNNLPLSDLLLPHLDTCKIYLETNNNLNLNEALIGEQVILNCDFYKQKSLKWYKNNDLINFDNQSDNYKLLNNGSILMKTVNLSDEANFTCGFNPNHHSYSYELKIFDTPLFVQTPEKFYEINSNSSIVLNCKATGKPKPVISWINKSLNRNISVGEILWFQNVNSSIDGNYECIASNNYGFAIRQFTINVKGGDLDLKPSNLGFGARSNLIGSLFTNQDLHEAVQEAKLSVEQAIQNTLDILKSNQKINLPLIDYKDQPFLDSEITNLNEEKILFKFNNQSIKKNFTPSRLMKIARFPLNIETIEASKSIEIYEKAIELLKRKAEMNQKFETVNFVYTDLLTRNQLNLLNSLTGCLQGNRHHNLLKYQDCKFKPKFHQCYRTFDGVCNNLNKPLNGAAFTHFKRLLKPIYEDNLHLPVGWLDNKLYNGFLLPNPRKVTLRLLSSENVEQDDLNTHMLMQWGQFIDHDLDFSLPSVSFSTFDRINSVDCETTCTKTPPCFSIMLEKNDPRKNRPHFVKGRNSTYSNCIELIRSSSFCGSGLSSVNLGILMPREQVNQISSYLDASNVYGSLPALSLNLREVDKNNGKLKSSNLNDKQYLPFNRKNQWPNDCQQNPEKSDFGCFLAGDIRSNEQFGLTVMHTLWLREHNRLASELKRLNSDWNGEKLFQEARKIVIARMQFITYEHWLKYVLGPTEIMRLGKYKGYDENQDSSISNVFATAGFRFGHTLIQPYLIRLDENYAPHQTFKSILKLHEIFFSPHLVLEGGLDPILRGLLYMPMKKPQNNHVINSILTEHLFEFARHISLDLASINIQRGRDHGLPGYNSWRKFCGLKFAQTFQDLSNEIRNQTILIELQKLYGHPSNIDLWVGCVLEDKLKDAQVGPTFACLISEQFQRLRSGDRFWYENRFDVIKLNEIRKTSLAEVICLNSDSIQNITSDVFLVPNKQTFLNCNQIQHLNLTVWKQLQNNDDCY